MIESFLGSVVGGMLIVLGLSRIEQTAPRFNRLIGVIACALSSGVLFWNVREVTLPTATQDRVALGMVLVAALAAAGVICIAESAPKQVAVLRGVALVGGAAAIVFANLVAPVSAGRGVSAVRVSDVIGQVLAALVLGSVTVSWLLGHAYLTATKMTIAPLRRVSRLFTWSVIARIVFLMVALGAVRAGWLSPPAGDVWVKLTGAWLILSLRVGVGLVAVAVFAYMVADCVRLRSTQSATGILYFASIFVYIGELCSRQLAVETGISI